jgi:hypothetical protein
MQMPRQTVSWLMAMGVLQEKLKSIVLIHHWHDTHVSLFPLFSRWASYSPDLLPPCSLCILGDSVQSWGRQDIPAVHPRGIQAPVEI